MRDKKRACGLPLKVPFFRSIKIYHGKWWISLHLSLKHEKPKGAVNPFLVVLNKNWDYLISLFDVLKSLFTTTLTLVCTKSSAEADSHFFPFPLPFDLPEFPFDLPLPFPLPLLLPVVFALELPFDLSLAFPFNA